MVGSQRTASTLDGRHVVIALGAVYVLLGVVRAATQPPLGRSVASIGVVFVFIAGSGLVVAVGGYRLSRREIDSQFYARIAWWCLGGIGAMVAMLSLYHLQPDIGLSEPERSVPILTGFGCVAGFVVGTYDARAKTATHRLRRQNRTLERMRAQLEESNADLELESLPRVEGDASQLRQLFQNLLSNALEYSGEERPRVSVGADRDGSEWLVSVSDEGIGIDPADQERIFQIFQRLHSHEEYEGTGIGLALCKRIVDRHSGEIRVDSEPGEGGDVFGPVAGDG